jgi:hypothetical protein
MSTSRKQRCTVDSVRTAALALPETTEQPHFDMASFRIGGKIFVTIPPSNDRAHIFVPEDVVRAFVAEQPAAFEELWWGKRLYGVIVHLASATRSDMDELLETAWLAKAPKRVAAAYVAGRK